MEENPQPRFSGLIISCALIGTAGQSFGDVCGVSWALVFILNVVPEKLLYKAICGGAILGFGVGQSCIPDLSFMQSVR